MGMAGAHSPPLPIGRAVKPRAAHGPSSPDQLVQAIKNGILLGRYVPGQRLVEADLTHEYQLSRGPVREALKRLAAEGILEHSRHRGAHVRLLTRREMLDLMQVIQAVVGLAVRLATPHMKIAEHRARLKQAYQKLISIGPDGERVLQSIDRNNFYEAIFDIAGNRELARIHPAVLTQILRMQILPYLPHADRAAQFADYKLMCDAMLAGDVREANRVSIRHNRRSCMHIRQLPENVFGSDSPSGS
jgi:DNA-binding GntR family transcriptional regulator